MGCDGIAATGMVSAGKVGEKRSPKYSDLANAPLDAGSRRSLTALALMTGLLKESRSGKRRLEAFLEGHDGASIVGKGSLEVCDGLGRGTV